MDFPSPPPSPGRSRPDCKRDTEQVFSKDPKGLPCSPQFVQIGLVSGGATWVFSLHQVCREAPPPLQRESETAVALAVALAVLGRRRPSGRGFSRVCPAAACVLPPRSSWPSAESQVFQIFWKCSNRKLLIRSPLALSFPFRSTERSHVGWSREPGRSAGRSFEEVQQHSLERSSPWTPELLSY